MNNETLIPTKSKEVIAFAFKHPETGRVNEKQVSFHDKVMLAIARKNKFRRFFYGGAMRGGKTFVILFILVKLARLFPKSRWHVIRSSLPELEDTTIPSMEKLIGTHGPDFIWIKKSSNYHIRFANGSKIFFKSEKLDQDPELKWMLGLETNGIFMEQMEGLSEKLHSRALERAGSWYIPNMPPPLIFGSFNPTFNWVKKEIYDKWRNDTLPEDTYFEEALPEDNPYVTPDQWAAWENLDPITKAQLINAVWRFLTDAKLFAYAFNPEKHVVDVRTEEGRAKMAVVKGLPVKVTFDFNVDPITAIVSQNDGMKWLRIIKEYRLRNSDIFEICERINNDWGDYYIVASGDASGRNRSALTKGNRTYVKTIQKELRLGPLQMKFPIKNPSVRNTRILLNSILYKHKDFLISSECLYTIQDLETVKVKDNGDIDKTSDAAKSHLLDNVRYLTWNDFKNFIQFYE